MTEKSSQEQIDEIWQLFRETAAQFKETEARFRETDARFKETDATICRLEGTFGIQWGRMMEALVAPAVLELFRARDIDVHYTYRRLGGGSNGRQIELDIVLENNDEAVVVEVKSLVKAEDVDDLREDLTHISAYFSRFKQRRVYGGLAGLEFAEGVDRYAYRQGFFVLKLTGEGIVTIENDDQFKPRNFGGLQ